VHFLELGAPELRSEWHSYLGEIATGRRGADRTWQSHLNDPTFQDQWRSYATRQDLPYLDLAYQPKESKPPRSRALSAPEVELHLARLNWLSDAPASRSKALQSLERAAVDPALGARVDLLSAAIALEAGELVAAQRALRAVVQRRAEEERALPLLVEVELQLSQQDQPPVARSSLNEAVALLQQQKASSARALALAQFKLAFGDASEAANLSGFAVQSSPRCSRCWLVHAVALAAKGESTSALHAIQRASQLLPETADRSAIKRVQTQLETTAPRTRQIHN
jgi:Tfp pilus assembly protein PilF